MRFRKILSLLSVVSLLLSAVSCGQPSQNTDPASSENAPAAAAPSNDGRSYTDLTPHDYATANVRYFGKQGDSTVLQLLLPGDWSCLSASNETHTLMRDGKVIGEIFMGTASLPNGFLLEKSDENNYDNVRCEWSILADQTQYAAEDRYFQSFTYHYKSDGQERAVTMTVRYTEINDFLSRKLRVGSSTRLRSTDSALGSIPLSASSKGKTVLILGNSFVNSSQIGAALQDMFETAGVPYTVTAVSVGYATVSKTWSDYISRMKNGEFAAVFMCGFYSGTDVSAFGAYVNACNASSTPIVIFPAHNEGSGDQAARSYPNVHFLNWKGEINALIETGVDYWDFCINDTHKHSKPLAGYVGAHMIYRALFGKLPQKQSYYGSLSHQEISSLLGDYISNGFLVLIPDKDITYLE